MLEKIFFRDSSSKITRCLVRSVVRVVSFSCNAVALGKSRQQTFRSVCHTRIHALNPAHCRPCPIRDRYVVFSLVSVTSRKPRILNTDLQPWEEEKIRDFYSKDFGVTFPLTSKVRRRLSVALEYIGFASFPSVASWNIRSPKPESAQRLSSCCRLCHGEEILR